MYKLLLLDVDGTLVKSNGEALPSARVIEAVGMGIAMGDAPDEVKQLADDVTASLADDGVAVAIEKYILK